MYIIPLPCTLRQDGKQLDGSSLPAITLSLEQCICAASLPAQLNSCPRMKSLKSYQGPGCKQVLKVLSHNDILCWDGLYYYAPLCSHQSTCQPQGRVGMCAGRCGCTRRCAQSFAPRINSFLICFCKASWAHQDGDQLPEPSPAWDLASDPLHQSFHLVDNNWSLPTVHRDPSPWRVGPTTMQGGPTLQGRGASGGQRPISQEYQICPPAHTI